MNYYRLQSFVALILFFAFDHIIAGDDFPPFTYGHFQITNRMTQGKVVRSHCFLGEVDPVEHPGYITIGPGETRGKTFRIDWYASNTYTCVISRPWDRIHIKFVAYTVNGGDPELMTRYCGSYSRCEWIVKDDGLDIHNIQQGWVGSRYGWFPDNPPPSNAHHLAPTSM
ncbi:hypothetical protein ACFE04_011037 [Oxalis oulophora]